MQKSSNFYECNGTCIATTEMCHGVCANGFRDCEGKCVPSSDFSFIDCNGKCQSTSKQCDGSCSSGYFKVGDSCKSDKEKKNYHECNGVFIDLETPCDGLCNGRRVKCRGERCLESWETRKCDGETCIDRNEVCNGTCKSSWEVPCGDHCIGINKPCEGRCHDDEYPFMCMGHFGETCISIKKIGDGAKDCKDGSDETTSCVQGWRCNGILQCINKPCHDHGTGEKKCPTTIKKLYQA